MRGAGDGHLRLPFDDVDQSVERGRVLAESLALAWMAAATSSRSLSWAGFLYVSFLTFYALYSLVSDVFALPFSLEVLIFHD